MIFMVVPLGAGARPDAIGEAVKNLGVPVYSEYEPNAWFVSYQGTTKDLARVLGFEKLGQTGTGIVVSLGQVAASYFGFASPGLWEWLRVYESKT